jgi:hypothetical protein
MWPEEKKKPTRLERPKEDPLFLRSSFLGGLEAVQKQLLMKRNRY